MQKCGEKQDWRLIYVLIWQTGDVALPGGKVEKVDADDSATAFREANEEIGLEPNLVQVVAALETFISQVLWLSLFPIWYFFCLTFSCSMQANYYYNMAAAPAQGFFPVVGLLARKGDFRPSLNSDEVDAIFNVPLEMFLKVFINPL